MCYLVYERNYIKSSILWSDIISETGVCGDLYAISRYYQIMQNRLLKATAEQKFKNRFQPVGPISSQVDEDCIWLNAKIDINKLVDPIVDLDEAVVVLIPPFKMFNGINSGLKEVFNGSVMQDQLAAILEDYRGICRYWRWNENILQFFYNEPSKIT